MYSVVELLALACDSPAGCCPGVRIQAEFKQGLSQQALGKATNLCPQLLCISTPGLELYCIVSVFKENSCTGRLTALPIRWACHICESREWCRPPHTSAARPVIGVPTAFTARGAAKCVSSVLIWGRGAFSCFASTQTC